MDLSKVVEISDILTPAGVQGLKVGQTLGFKQPNGSIKRLKIVRKDVKKGRVWAEPVILMTQEEAELKDKLSQNSGIDSIASQITRKKF